MGGIQSIKICKFSVTHQDSLDVYVSTHEELHTGKCKLTDVPAPSLLLAPVS